MEPVNVEESVSSMVEESASSMVEHDKISDADTVSEEVESKLDPLWVFESREMEKIPENGDEYRLIERGLLSSLGPLAEETRIVAVHKNLVSSLTEKARLQCFMFFCETVARKNGGNANCWPAWYGASKKEICEILAYGFTAFGKEALNGFDGSAICLSPFRSSLNQVLSAEVDEDGLSHILLCRVILGKTEVVDAGSKQFHPTSTDFDCGVDNLVQPSKYIVWSSIMNSHIYPAYVVSFKATYLGRMPLAATQWVRLHALISVLSCLLDSSRMAVISKCYKEFQENKLPKSELIKVTRQVAGDKLVIAVIKFCINKICVTLDDFYYSQLEGEQLS